MIELDPAKRIYVKEAMKHPYFDDLNREDIVKYFPVGQEKLALQYGRWTIFNLIKIKYEYIYYIYNLAYKFYTKLLDRIVATPASRIQHTRIRVPDYQKAGLMINALLSIN